MNKSLKRYTLYWSSLQRYEGCPQHFLWGRGWGAIDVGGGPGKRKPVPEQKSRHHAVMGIAIQAGIEAMYNEQWYRRPQEMMDLMIDEATTHFNREILTGYIDWRESPSRTDLLQVVLAGVRGYVTTMKQHRLLGAWTEAEMDLIGFIDEGNPIGGRADTVFRRTDTGVTILDGKNSNRYLDRKTGQWFSYTDPDQLRWYALCYFLKFGVLPDRLAFVYYRFPYGYTGDKGYEDIPSDGIDWVPFAEDDLKGLAARALEARAAMNAEKFDANPSPQGCRFCEYETVCTPRQEQKKKNQRGRKPKRSILPEGKGMMDLDLG